MRITLYLNDRLINYKLPNEISGSFSFFSTDDDINLINIESRNNKWYIYRTKDVEIYFNNNAENNFELQTNQFYVLKKGNQSYLIYVSEINVPNILTYSFNANLNLLIASNNANINYNCPYLNDLLINIHYKNNILMLEQKGNTRIYINKIVLRTNSCILNYGDELEIYGLRIIFLNGLILINNIKNNLTINMENSGIMYYNFPKQSQPENIDFNDIDLYNKDEFFSKAPRLRRVIETKNIKLSSPPRDEKGQDMPMLLVIGPMLTMGIVSMTTFLQTITNIKSGSTTIQKSWPQLVSGGVMLVSMLVWPLVTQAYSRRIKKKKQKELIEKYNKYLDEKRVELSNELEQQRIILYENLIDLNECLNIIKRRGFNFWDKRNDQSDFLVVRIGKGNELLDVNVQYPDEGFTIEENELKNKADQLVKDFKYINDVPIGYSFYENKNVAIMGTYYKTVCFMNNIILQLITFYSYEDIKIVMFTNSDRERNWNYLKYLNHNFTNDRSFRFFATDQDSSKEVANYLSFEISNRKNQFSDKNFDGKPYYIIITDNYDQIKRYDFINEITEAENNLGFSVIILENKLSKLPSKCNNFITIGENNSSLLKNSYEKQEQIDFKDEVNYNINMMEVTKKLSNIPIEFEEGLSELPQSLSFLEMEKVGKVEQLNILNRWNTNDATSSLKAEIGVDELGDLMFLDLHEKFHGPHGLIAGTTGSGKSEFIITYILSMCINYSPDDVAFILIDYKGGGLALAFENKTLGISLPHLAGTITNLDKAEMDRTLVSIDSEVKRRQRLFNEARDNLGESTIDIYKYQRLFKDQKVKEAMPHLFIICDEFAELKSQQPDFMDNLISVARIGRSLGVHLILATQKPSGVVNDQIWSNTRFRVCLKVQSEQDSKEMLKRPEAAYIKEAGRYYLQVGYDEVFSLGQSGYSGAKYFPSNQIVKQSDKSINFINDCGLIIKSIKASSGNKLIAEGEQLSNILTEIIETAKKVNKRVKRLWLENIPDNIFIDDLECKYNFNHQKYYPQIILGEYDAPENQEQGPYIYNYLENGNTVIYGNDGSERELLLNTLIYSTVKNYSSEEINFYLIDYGSESLNQYQRLPHVGGVVLPGEDEEYNNLIKLIKKELVLRKKLFVDYGGEYTNYIKNCDNKLPVIVVIINNYDSLYESYSSCYEIYPELIRDSERYGVIFIFTCNATNSIPTKITQNIKSNIAYKLKDVSDYMSIFSSKLKTKPKDILGRGIIKKDTLHEFQTAKIVDDESLSNFLQNFISEQKSINKVWAKKIPTLPDIVRFADIKDHIINLNSIPVGISKSNLDITEMDFLNNSGNIITSTKLSNINKFVKSLLSIFRVVPNSMLIVIDPTKDLLLDNRLFPNYYTENLDEIIDKIIDYVKQLIETKSNQSGIILIHNIIKINSHLSDINKIKDLMEIIKKYENISVIITEEATKLKNVSYDPWFNGNFSLTNGIWIGNGISEQSLIRVSTIKKEMMNDIPNSMGYVINESMVTLCKFIDFISVESEE